MNHFFYHGLQSIKKIISTTSQRPADKAFCLLASNRSLSSFISMINNVVSASCAMRCRTVYGNGERTLAPGGMSADGEYVGDKNKLTEEGDAELGDAFARSKRTLFPGDGFFSGDGAGMMLWSLQKAGSPALP